MISSNNADVCNWRAPPYHGAHPQESFTTHFRMATFPRKADTSFSELTRTLGQETFDLHFLQ